MGVAAGVGAWAGAQAASSSASSIARAQAACEPAAIVFADDVKPDTLKRYKAILLVDERVELEPELLAALRAAKAAGTTVLYDKTCRESVVREFTALDVAFDKVEKDPNGAGDDSAYVRFRDYARANLPAVEKALSSVLFLWQTILEVAAKEHVRGETYG